MKKHSRSLALLLALITLISLSACSGSDIPEETTDAASTTAETTETIPEVTTEEPSVSVVAPPETTSPPETEEPKPTDILRIIMQDGRGEAILSGLAEEEYKPLLALREEALLRDHAIAIELSKTDNLISKIENLVLSGENDYDLILTDPAIGTQMLSDGLLEDVSGAGISMMTAPGINKSITDSLSFGSRTYLFSSYALVSDITSSYALRYSGAKLSSDPLAKALAGDFTTELLLGYLKESSFSMGAVSPLTLYRGIGGKIFTSNEKGIPTSALSDAALFGRTYGETLALASASVNDGAAFTLEKLSPLKNGEAFLPIPKASAELEYSVPLDHETISVLAAPAGVISGTRLNSLVSALYSCSDAYREGIRSSITGDGADRSADLLNVIEANTRLDLGILFGWGDIDDLIADSIEKGSSADTILSDRMTEMRNKAVDVAADIVADRLGIK